MKTKNILPNFSMDLMSADKRSFGFLKHILSPLEFSALRHNYTPFNFKLEESFIYTSGAACKQLMETTRQQVTFVSKQIVKDRYIRKVPRNLGELFDDPREIMRQPAYLRNRLCRIECYTLLKIMALGRQYFIDRKEFGPKSIKALESLFKKHTCEHLFK